MAALPPHAPQPISRPARPRDRRVHRPQAPHYPPTEADVIGAVKYTRDVNRSIGRASPVPGQRCTSTEVYNAILYEHAIVAQAVAAAAPQDEVPPWFQAAFKAAFEAAVQELLNNLRDEIQNGLEAVRGEILPPLMRMINKEAGAGDLFPLKVILFKNGDNPTEDPHNLPELASANRIEDLSPEQIDAYLIGYGYGAEDLPEGEDQEDTYCLRKEALKSEVGALIMA